ncbi:type III PLP-dependent enzyme [Sphaerisporangium krabiense]|uniref:Diaminopimelate decarboxylase n=1 Tax=Sphaerisporangium krabiense TaxID=763782 RepID=A0A7W8Z6D2_9ACTN|nr:type III PLP-dependent enzyme [Sphaerisporangium krabiense]MBB5628308.1 diaminopimelate decarboxylase [Sphaerisporangium krabiense]
MACRIATPAYVYDLAEVRRAHRLLRDGLPVGAGLYYSLKANAHPLVLEESRACGTLPEVCSAGELDSALAAGWAAADVLYGGPGRRDADVARAVRLGVRHFSVDSPVALDQLDRCAAAAGARCSALLRVNDDSPVPGQGLAMTGVPSQFGADAAWILADPAAFAPRHHADVTGLHLYMGTNLATVDDLVRQFAQSARTAARVAAALAPHGARLETLDLGGGFGAPFARAGGSICLDGLAPRLTTLLDEVFPGPGGPRVVFESGRYLTATAGTLYTRVLDVKRSQGRTVVVLESGVNHLGGMSGMRRLPPLSPELIRPGHGTAGDDGCAERDVLVAGPLCTPLDTWSRAATLPPLRVGDVLAVPNVGAYGLNASLVAFLGHPLPGEYVVDGDRGPDTVIHHSRLHLGRVTTEGNLA